MRGFGCAIRTCRSWISSSPISGKFVRFKRPKDSFFGMEESLEWKQCLKDAEKYSVPFDIHTAASLGDLEVVQYYLNRSETANGQVGWNPLLRAAWNGHVETTAALVDAARSVGVDPGAGSVDLTGRTALMVSAFHGYEDVVKLLAQGSAPMERDDNGRTALHHAVVSGNERVVRILLKAGADPNALDRQGNTPERLAERHGRTSLAKILSLRGPANLPTPLLDAITDGGLALHSLLAGLNLEKYWPVFEERGLGLSHFLEMQDEDLRNIGIKLFGPRRKMLLEIERLRWGGVRFQSVGTSRV